MDLTVTYSFLKAPTSGQIGQLTELYQHEGWWASSDRPALIERIIRGSHCFLVAVINDEIVGMGRCISDRCCDAYIQDVAVKQQHRGKGIASEMIRILSERLISDGIDWIGLIAEKNSHRFYEQAGFEQMRDSVPMLKKLQG